MKILSRDVYLDPPVHCEVVEEGREPEAVVGGEDTAGEAVRRLKTDSHTFFLNYLVAFELTSASALVRQRRRSAVAAASSILE